MEHIHGVDVSWMTHGNPKDKAAKAATRKRSLSSQLRDPATPSPAPGSPPANGANGGVPEVTTPTTVPPTDPSATVANSPKPITPTRPGFTRTDSADKKTPPAGTPPQRRGSWFSSISSKFSSSAGAAQSPPQPNTAPPKPAEIIVPKINPNKNAVLQHAARHEGEGPYTPAPPKGGQPGILHGVFRRLSSSNGTLGPAVKGNHGLVERRVLNVDHHRERCPISELNQAKLRRVAFCVDVEIAPMPRYAEAETSFVKKIGDKMQRRKLAEKGEGEALKHPKAVEEQKEKDGTIKATGEIVPKAPEKEGTDEAKTMEPETREIGTDTSDDKGTETKKKDKKKKSEEDRKARKEKRRKQAEANGTVPLEIRFDSDMESSVPGTPSSDGLRTHAMPTTNPVRVYRRCCQLRETPILKRITEQLINPANSTMRGVVEKLDLTGYWMQLADLITLGDYLAVVPVREVILENCGLTDEGLRVVLAGLLAAKMPNTGRRKRGTEPDGLTKQGGVVEKLILKNNKIGPEGWRHLCLFIYLCRSLHVLDVSAIPFPQRPRPNFNDTIDLCEMLSKSIGERLAGSTLELLNVGETGLNAEQLGFLIDGVIKCGLKRLGLAHNDIDADGVEHIARYLRSGQCEGLDLGGNNLRDQLQIIAGAITPEDPLWALSLAECDLKPGSLCKLLPTLAKLKNFRFIDLSHNHDLFEAYPSAVSVLRRYLPKLSCLKRIHLADCAMTSEHVIALAEVIPEIPELAHINFLENSELTKLADATTEEAQEEACALYASLLAATRVSTSLVCVDIDVPTEQSGELVRALAKQIVAYCLRNMERLPVPEIAVAVFTQAGNPASVRDPEYPDVIQHLVGHDVLMPDESDDPDAAPDDDYVIGGTGIAKALTCCLKNRGDDSSRQSGEFIREVEGGTASPRPKLPPGKAKDMTKHLLSSARKIRHRLQPALNRAKSAPSEDTQAYYRLLFLDRTLNGIIKRFEDEFPDTRESADSAISVSLQQPEDQRAGSLSSAEADADVDAEQEVLEGGAASDLEDDAEDDAVKAASLHRSNSVLSTRAIDLVNEEGRALRAGHKFRAGFLRPEHYGILLSGVEEIGADPNHARVLHEMLEELGDEDLLRQASEKGVVTAFAENRDRIFARLAEADPEHWRRFVESQEMARANVRVGVASDATGAAAQPADEKSALETLGEEGQAEEVAVVDD